MFNINTTKSIGEQIEKLRFAEGRMLRRGLTLIRGLIKLQGKVSTHGRTNCYHCKEIGRITSL